MDFFTKEVFEKEENFMKMSYSCRGFVAALAAVWLGGMMASALTAQPAMQTPPNFKIAILGDGGLGESDRAVLQMVKSEGAQAVVHSGDIDQKGSVAEWDAQVTEILGLDFPYFASIGDDDGDDWDGPGGLQQMLIDRLNRAGISWSGDLGVQSSLHYQGIFFLLVAPGIRGTGHDIYIRDQLAADNSLWSICSWHKNMHNLQVCDKPDGAGYGVYEEARIGGSLMVTGHCHAYARTHLLSSMANQTIASTSLPLQLEKGKSFVLISGLAGEGRAGQSVSGEWWAKIYTKAQNSQYGALFATFNVDGMPNKANFYFKNIDGEIIESFTVISNVEPIGPTVTVTSPNGGEAWTSGSTQNLTWTSTGFSDPVKIEYSADGGNNWTLLTGSTPNDGSYDWTITAAATSQARIRVSDAADGEPSDVSDGNFKIIGPATQLVKVSGDGQSGAVSTALPAPFVVRTLDAADNPVNGVAVTFGVTAGGGNLSNSQPQLTNSNGEAATVLTLGSQPGANTVTATSEGLAGSPQTFTATATIQPPNSNLALNKLATASSTYNPYTPDRAVNGSATGTSYWRSASVSKSNPNTWLRVDLGAAYTLTRGVVKWRENYFAKQYRFQISTTGGSNDSEWTTVATVTNGTIGTQDVPLSSPFAARYFRIRMDQNNKADNRVYELECYAGSSLAAKASGEAGGQLAVSPPATTAVLDNFPNPFNPGTNLRFHLPEAAHVTLKVYNMVGEEVATLVNAPRPAGVHTVRFEAANLPSGIYFSVLQAGEVRQIRRLILMK
jgi:hypothetical protein